MTANRQDAWAQEDDLLLAETVLRHIREGSTQLAAFEETAEKLSRTSAACGFRWNSTIRKKYEAEVALAKKKRAAKKREQAKTKAKVGTTSDNAVMQRATEEKAVPASNNIELADVIAFLQGLKEQQHSQAEAKQLQEENERLKQELEKIKKEKQVIADDYRALLEIMERARKWTNTDGEGNV
ncbi:RsfA family transcriptional regulator [Shouchella clausii]|uniref:RsfA family transcriptional regulator n=1 Tax=Shouchella clausii TaxID=79880 RepID=UPI000BA67663|nr:RsfA family transcriptional regulator [Shouchella clausii]PAF10328.1 RsfA family transcriptional regulator [Shouchella clausii]